MKQLIFGVIIFLCILIEGTIFTIPLVFDLLLLTYIFKRESWILVFAFIAGIFLDIISIKTIGQSSLFFTLFLFVVFFYEKRFELLAWPFIAWSSFLGSLIFFAISGFQNVIIYSFLNSLIAVGIFRPALYVLNLKRQKSYMS